MVRSTLERTPLSGAARRPRQTDRFWGAVALGLLGCGGPGSTSDADTDGEDGSSDGTGAATSVGPASTSSADGRPGTTSDDATSMPTTESATDSTGGDPDDDSDSGSSSGEDSGSDGPTPECEGDDAVACYGGGLGTLNVGVCAAGIQTCEDEMWSECVGEILPSDEVCNGDDDDCDGETDEGCECSPGQTQPCYTGPLGTEGVGSCAPGVETCDDAGTWGACEDDVVPVVETCDGSDDDCDREVDEGCECTPGETQPCYSGPAGTEGVGECAAGTQTCTAAALWSECEDETTPAAESCNGDDDDCNGDPDDIAPGDACDSGEFGECAAGQEACVGGEIVCEATVTPQLEVCDNLDNDCDDQVDEDLEDDPILLAGDMPDTWSTTIPLVGSYPGASAGIVSGRLHDASDEDWFSVFAQEQVIDVIGDTPVVGTVTIESPGPGFSYEACACWSTSTAFCGKTQGGAFQVCATSDDGGMAQLEVSMAMILAVSDEGWLDVVVRPDNPTDVGCDLYEVGWFISET